MSKLAIHGGKPIRKKAFLPWPHAGVVEKRYLKEVVESNGWGIFRGDKIERFGQQFAAYHKAEYGIPCSNGTAALQVQLLALGIGRGDEVITSIFTCASTVAGIMSVGAVPIFVDIREKDYCMNHTLIEQRITRKTKAIMAVHLYGALCDLDALRRLCRRHKLFLVEDAAQVPGSFWRNKGVGTIGISGSFSFQESKVMSSGEGGIIITNDRELSELAHSYINCGRRQPDDKTQRLVMGFNFRMTEFQAALLLAQLETLEERTAIREQNAAYLSQRLIEIPGIGLIQRNSNITKQAYYYYIFKYNQKEVGIPRQKFIQALEAEGIPTRNVFVPLYKDPLFNINAHDTLETYRYYRAHPLHAKNFPTAEKAAFEESVAIWHPLLLGNRSDIDDIADAIEKVVIYASELKNSI